MLFQWLKKTGMLTFYTALKARIKYDVDIVLFLKALDFTQAIFL